MTHLFVASSFIRAITSESLGAALNRVSYYIRSYLGLGFARLRPISAAVNGRSLECSALSDRLEYYCQIASPFTLTSPKSLSHLFQERRSVYFFDLLEFLRFFPSNSKFSYLFGDVTHVPSEPTLVKSRPIGRGNTSSIVFKLEKLRHFRFARDPWRFEGKLSRLAWRGKLHLNVRKETRLEFLRKFFDHPLIDCGHTNREDTYPQFRRRSMSITEQLRYKYILSLEGVDVATNLKWIMSSNSLCFSQRPRFETWYMEGRLIPGFHYVEVADDFSDLEEKIDYYEVHPGEATEIIRNANAYVEQFKDPLTEDLLCMLVLDKYLRLCLNNEGVFQRA